MSKIKLAGRLQQLKQYIDITAKGVIDSKTPVMLEFTHKGIQAKVTNSNRSFVRYTKDDLCFPDIDQVIAAPNPDELDTRVLMPLASMTKLTKSLSIATTMGVEDITMDITYSPSPIKIGPKVNDVAEYNVATKVVISYGSVKQSIAVASLPLVYYIEDPKFMPRLRPDGYKFYMELAPEHIQILSSLIDINKVESDEKMNGTIELQISNDQSGKVMKFFTRNKSNASLKFEGNSRFVDESVETTLLLSKKAFINMIKGSTSLVDVYYMGRHWLAVQKDTPVGDIYLINAAVPKAE